MKETPNNEMKGIKKTLQLELYKDCRHFLMYYGNYEHFFAPGSQSIRADPKYVTRKIIPFKV